MKHSCPTTLIYRQLYGLANPDKIRTWQEKNRNKNRLTILIYGQLYRLAFPEKTLACSRKYFGFKGAYRKYPELKGLTLKDWKRAYYEENKTKYKQNSVINFKKRYYGDFAEVAALTKKLQMEILCQEKQTQEKH